MGVPKFFRYISERYPCLSELVKEYQIPDFDNLYLDMNGIIHMCSHPDDNNPHFRITEEKIFKDIFHYIEVLFRMIRPKKLFFMAVDGVAPRAKMNQQRGRRFRAAKDAMKQEQQAKKKGETLPTDARFDSNCITPGTVFMARLQDQLKYFVVDKISNDPLWQNCKIILSGHETPGEGEHKIMDYIRYMRSQPNYDPNTRHCLYGLDADLIMLGLCTHEPHFSLLREEVKFGKKSNSKRQSVPEEITFFLLHLSLMRDYLELEFGDLKNKISGFEFDLEKIIDDWVLMGFLVGNDFIPNLPNLHIANGALPILCKAYMDVLPTLDGYINEGGTLNLPRFEKFMEKLGNIDVENFEEIRDDLLYMEAKTGKKYSGHAKVCSGKVLEEWADEDSGPIGNFECLEPEKPKDSGLAALIKQTDDMYLDSSEESDKSDDEDTSFMNYKKEYYKNKLEYANVTPEVMRAQAEGYVRAIQWNLNYYYNGVCSWSWYYPHHYSPYISDIKGFSDLKIEFDLAQPFKPYEQLLGVLPAASKNLLPVPYHRLMTDNSSIIKHFYPEDFETDLNGKKQEWEAVVLIPFLDEKLLLEAMQTCNDELSAEEKQRNTHGPMLVYTYTNDDLGQYRAPEYFPTIPENHAMLQSLTITDIMVPKEKLVKGRYPGASFDVYYTGFPTFKHIKYEATLAKAGVKVFEQPSRSESMVVTISTDESNDKEDIPVEMLETCVYVGWPHLTEAKVVAISTKKQKYLSLGGPNQYNVEDKSENMVSMFKKEGQGVVERYKNRMGIICGDVKMLVHVKELTGKKYVAAPDGKLILEKQFADNTSNYPIQTVVSNITTYVEECREIMNMSEVFKEGTKVFSMANPYYGAQGVVLNSTDCLKNGRIKICITASEEPDMSQAKQVNSDVMRSYKTLYNIATYIGIPNNLFSRVTGTVLLTARNGEGGLKTVNIGLDLKFNKKNKETPGYTRKIGPTWYYTLKTCDLVQEYAKEFPEVFEYLNIHTNFDENITAEAIFGEDADERLKTLQTWLRTIPTHDIERQTCGCSAIEPDAVKEIENIVDTFLKSSSTKKMTMQVKPSFLYKPDLQSHTLVPDEKVTIHLYDRVVNVRHGYSVPFGLKGTIIAIKQSADGSSRDTMYDVVFDQTFKDGMEISNCSPNRGYRIPKTAFLNLSHGIRLAQEKDVKKPSNNPHFIPTQVQRHQQLQKSTQAQQLGGQQMSFPPPPLRQPPQQHNMPHPGPSGFYPNATSMNRQPNYPQPTFRQGQEHSAFASFVNSGNHRSGGPGFTNHPHMFMMHQSQQQPQYPQEFNNTRQQNKSDWKKDNSNGFMPTFGGDRQHKNVSNKAVKVLKKEENKNDEVSVDKRSTVNTDFLKTILKIGETTANKENSNKQDPNKTRPTNGNNGIGKSAEGASNVSFEMLAQAAKAPASVSLLTYFQSNGLGVPRYQYYKPQKDLEQAQITLPNGEIIRGNSARTREEASENVAVEALAILMNKAKFTQGLSSTNTGNFPTPPKTWVKSHRAETKHNQPTLSNNPTAENAVLSNQFVPLQAIKRQMRKTSGAQADRTTNEKKNHLDTTKKMEEKDDKTKPQTNRMSSSQHKKKPAPRKPRIAANFIAKS